MCVSRTMKKFNFAITLLFLLLFIQVNHTQASQGHMYEESITAYSRVNGETYRWEMTREFLIKDYKFSNGIVDNQSQRIATINLLADTQRGQLQTIVQPTYGANFDAQGTFNGNGDLLELDFSILYFRDTTLNFTSINNPLGAKTRNALAKVNALQYDITATTQFYSANIQYYEYQNLTKDLTRLRVNTEISTKNYNDGRIERSAIHMVKRLPDASIIFEYDHTIQEKSIFQRYWNYLDQPYLWVPIRLLAVFLLVFSYIKLHKFVVKRGITIVQTYGKEIKLVEPEDASGNEEVTNE